MSDYEYETDTEEDSLTQQTKVEKQYIPPHKTDKKESDIEDIVIDGVARKRPATIKYLCPFTRHLDVGKTYKWCACGKSNDVWCDDSCGPYDLAPLVIKIDKAVSINSICACRYTASPPYCDGVHYQPHVGQDEWAEEYGLEPPPCCKDINSNSKKNIRVEEEET